LIETFTYPENMCLARELLPFAKNKTATNEPTTSVQKAIFREVYVTKKTKCLLMF